jgi:aminoglycoside 3-N-acetyltransferase I
MDNLQITQVATLEKLRELTKVFSLAFETTYDASDQYLLEMLGNKSTVILGAFADEKIVGGVVAFEFSPIHGAKEMYLYDIAVHPSFQKRGYGRKLLSQLKEVAQSRGVETIFVEAESQDDHAVTFYRSIGGEEVLVNHFNFVVNK